MKQETYGTRTFARFLVKKNTCKRHFVIFFDNCTAGGIDKIGGLRNYRMKDVHISTDKLSALLSYTSMEIAIHDFISFQQ